MKHLYIDIFCLIFILLLWPFTSPKYLDADLFFYSVKQVKKSETFCNALIVASGVLCFIYVFIESVILIVQQIHAQPKTTLSWCISLLGCEYLIHDMFEQLIESVVESMYGNFILQIPIHILMYVFTFEIFQISTSSLGIVYIYLCITHFFITPISTMFFISSILIVCLIIYKVSINDNRINFQNIKIFLNSLRNDNQRLGEIYVIVCACGLIKVVDIQL